MDSFLWHDAYYSDLQSLYALLVAPLAFLAWRAAAPTDHSRAVVPEAARFVSGLTLVFAVATMIDPISTGPLAHSEGINGTFAATLIMFSFVLLGDLRVLLLAIGVARPERTLSQNLRWAAGTTLIVPLVAGASYFLLGQLVDDLHSQALWMLYEAGFLILCIALSRCWIPRVLASAPDFAEKTRFLRAVFGFSAAYYALWLAADVLIVVAELDLGWGIRIVPNQLYYAFWVPFVYARFFSANTSVSR